MRSAISDLKSEYYMAKAKKDHSLVYKMAKENFAWVCEYLFEFIGHHKSNMLRNTNEWKHMRNRISDLAGKIKHSKRKSYSPSEVVDFLKQMDEAAVNSRNKVGEKPYKNSGHWPLGWL